MRVAVTGGIGSGKTIVCSVFKKLGIPVFYADMEAKRLMDTNPLIKEELVKYFGNQIYNDENKLIRTKFASLIFNDSKALSFVNSVIHPAVRNEFARWATEQNSPYVIQEAAIIVETGQATFFDKIIAVHASQEIRVQRVMKRDQVDRVKVIERIKNQLNSDELLKYADYIIENDGTQMIVPQILTIHNKLL